MSLVLLGILNSQVTGAAAGSYDLLETQVLTSSASSVTFTGLGSYTDYRHLQVRMAFKGDQTLWARFNSDSGSNYSWHYLEGNGSSVTSAAVTSASYIAVNVTDTLANHYSPAVIDILDFANTNKNTTIKSLFGSKGNNSFIYLISGLWQNTNALTDITLICQSGNILTGSRFSLYGVK